jgi:cysteinyl-tRNA synthetase
LGIDWKQILSPSTESEVRQAVASLEDTGGEVQRLVDARNAARKAKDFREADRIRDELAARRIVLKDNPDGTTIWEWKR